MGTALNGRTIAFLIASEGAEQAEVLQPWDALITERFAQASNRG
jgi:hypothetical protein